MTSAENDKRLGVAIIGASMRSTMMFDYLQRHPNQGFVVGIYDVIPSRSEYLIEKYSANGAVVFESLGQAVDDRIQVLWPFPRQQAR